MNTDSPDPREFDALLQRSRDLLVASTEALDARTRSRLNQARHAALGELAGSSRPFRVPSRWLPAGALAAAVALSVAVWIAHPGPGPAGGQLAEVVAAEDAELLASSEGPELYAEDAEFYEWAGGDATGGEG